MKNQLKLVAFLMMLSFLLSATNSISEEAISNIDYQVEQESSNPVPVQIEGLVDLEKNSTIESQKTTEKTETIPSTSTVENLKNDDDAETPTETSTDTPTTETTAEIPDIITTQKATIADIYFSLRWQLVGEKDVLRPGDEITLQCIFDTEPVDLSIQWQVAVKEPSSLKENEPEWADIPGAQNTSYTFTIQEGMESWRWRLCVTLPDGESVYSDELRLSELVTAQPNGEPEATDEEDQIVLETIQPLPFAKITLTADDSLEDIIFGTEITLTAEIQNPREDMLLQWQFMPVDAGEAEESWQDIHGAASTAYTYIINEENNQWLWRLLITVPEDKEPNKMETSEDGGANPQLNETSILDIPKESNNDSETVNNPTLYAESEQSESDFY